MKQYIQTFENAFPYSDELIELLEQANQWKDATITTSGKKAEKNEARLCETVVLGQIKYKSDQLKQKLRLSQLNSEIQASFKKCLLSYIEPHKEFLEITRSEPFSVLKYTSSHYYKPHSDGDTANFQRRLSGLIYLNENYQGGHLNFPFLQHTIQPKRHMVVLFPSNFCFVHESEPIISGTKYAIVSWFR